MGKNCPICNEEYDEKERSPRSLPCSHTLCSMCIGNLISRNSKTCPFCSRKFNASSARDIGVNAEVLELLKLLKEMELKANTSHQAPASSSGLIDEVKRETQRVTNELLVDCQKADEEINSLLQSNKQLLNVFSKAEKVLKNSILTNINEMVTQNVDRVTYLKEQSQNLESQKMVIKEKRNKIKKAKTKAESAETFTKAGVVADEVGCMKTDLQKTLGSFMGQVSEEENMQLKLKKVAETTNEKIVLLGKIVTSSGKDDSVSFVPDIKKMAIQESVPQNITIESLLSRVEPVLDLIRQGKIFAYMEFEGSMRYAQLSLDENNRMCLHCLREQILPPNAQILQHRDVMNIIDVSSRTTFLNFGTDEKSLGRIYVSLTPNTKRSQNFLALCMGEKGPSYLNSQIIEVRFKGTVHEQIVCGDYDGIGGKAVILGTGIEYGGILRQPWLEGSVVCWYADDNKAAKFRICMRDSPGDILNIVFGKVESNLHNLKKAISLYQNISDVKITDCGIVIPI